ncbi:cbb3-type cytochrome c oxidase subunit I [Actinoplanes oblitus]|uniref:Cbb3-type cytochrome c oxidase subunit I n=1 Tax=Actinoplanes oblitus TaxID=3040509 RepID=A0ABY8W5C7_9ACTN|nr:cbb3-type cytochrome c oxidase subunit I [Actinoplanes oblitus]WIM93041.1 cbb3-type cytochrome c oxidase subunit I [Actinoplanes oblitus]
MAVKQPGTAEAGRRPLLVSKAWIQAVALVMLVGFGVMGLLAYRTYTAEPPIPQRVVAPDGRVLFTGDDVSRGQQIFLHNGLMEYGSVFGHGAYLGPDFTDDYLHRAAESVTRQLGAGAGTTAQRVVHDFQHNQYDAITKTLTYTTEQAVAFDENVTYYSGYFSADNTAKGLRPKAITDPTRLRQMTAFFSWSAWAASAHRPGKDYSYTNNWPPEPLVGNTPTANVLVWSVLSLVALLAGIGALFFAFGRWGERLGWRGRQADTISFRGPDAVTLTPAQRATAWFFLVVGLLFLVQTLVGAASEHYRAEVTGFFGFDLARLLPYNLVRTWHLQLSLFWVSAAFLAAGIFLAPIIAGREPKRQSLLAYLLLAAVAVVVFGSLIGEALSIHGVFAEPGSFLGSQGFEYLDLARVWQVLLTAGLFVWAAILFRGVRTRLRRDHAGNMPWLFFLSACAIPAFYAVGLLADSGDNFTHADFWRFWVVHLWVEDFLELFTTVMVAYIFVMLGVVRERVAMTVIYLDIVLYSAGGVIGTMHHLYFSGEPAEHMALGAFFSAAEVIPLTFLTVEAWSFLQLGARQENRSATAFPHRWAVMFLVAVGFWNFLGAGIFGFLINLPIVSYYEIGTALTANHGHAAMMGVYGMLAMGLALFCLRYLIPEDKWPDRLAKISFWSANLGLLWMCFATLLPLGILQLYESVDSGYHAARTLEYVTDPTNSLIEWLRLPGDVVFIVGGVLPFLWICWLGVRHAMRRGRPTTLDEPDEVLFTDITVPAEDGRQHEASAAASTETVG